ncbi:MAG: S1/P1 nuclease [Pirellulales bacterium]
MRYLISFCATVALLCVCRDVSAWADTGHKVVASIAMRRLSPEDRETIVEILSHHPRFKEEFQDRMPADVRENAALKTEWLFQQAAVWPDIVREYKGETRDALHRPTWHYINYASFLIPTEKAELLKSIPPEGRTRCRKPSRKSTT